MSIQLVEVRNSDGQQIAAPPFDYQASVPPTGHAYFEWLSSLPQMTGAWSLRSQAQLDSLTAAKNSQAFTYAPTVDTHPLRQDAAKFTKTQMGIADACAVSGGVRIVGSSGTVVPGACLFTRSDGAQYRRVSTSSVTVGSTGVLDTNVVAVLPGMVYRLPAGTLLAPPTELAGVTVTSGTTNSGPTARVETRCSDSIAGAQQLKMGILHGDVGDHLLTFDWMYGPEFITNVGVVKAYKMFQVSSDGKHRWWTGDHVYFNTRPNPLTDVGVSDQNFDIGMYPPGLIANGPLRPTGLGAAPMTGSHSSFADRVGVVQRYWFLIELFRAHTAFAEWEQLVGLPMLPNPDDLLGRWHRVSLWIADEQREAQRVVYRVPMSMKTGRLAGLETLDFEFNTSETAPAQSGSLVGYVRNVVMLWNYALPARPEDDTRLFERPHGVPALFGNSQL